MRDEILIMLIGGGCAAAVSLCGLLALRLQTGRAVTLKLFTVITAIVLAMAAGAIGTMQAMFLTQHDCGVVLVVCVAVAVCAAALAAPLARSVSADSRALSEAVRTLADGDPDQNSLSALAGTAAGTEAPGTGPGLATAELEQVRRMLADTSRRLAASRERERSLARSRRELVAWVSHDLRAPLVDLQTMAEALEDDAATDPGRYHAQMRSSVDRLSAMVDDLVEMSRAHAGALRMSLAATPLAVLVNQAVPAARALAHTRRVALAADVNTPVSVRVDTREMGRALDDLLENTIRHVPPGGTVHIDAGERDGSALLVVTDTCGRPAHGDVAGSRHTRWLTIVRGIVETHSGEVTMHNAVDGCRIEVRLPLPADPAEQERTEAVRTVEPGRPGHHGQLVSLSLAAAVIPPTADQPDRPDRPAESGRPTLTLPRRRRTP